MEKIKSNIHHFRNGEIKLTESIEETVSVTEEYASCVGRKLNMDGSMIIWIKNNIRMKATFLFSDLQINNKELQESLMLQSDEINRNRVR